MGQLKYAVDEPAFVASQGANVVRFDTRRRASRIRSAAADRSGLSEGVVTRFAPAAGRSRERESRTEAGITKGQPESLRTSDPRFTTFDFVATAFLILSVFAGPELVWTLLRSASFG